MANQSLSPFVALKQYDFSKDLKTLKAAELKAIPSHLLNRIFEQTGGQLPGACLICDDQPFFDGLFIDNAKRQVFVYSLCKKCFENPYSPILVNGHFRLYGLIENENWPYLFPYVEP